MNGPTARTATDRMDRAAGSSSGRTTFITAMVILLIAAVVVPTGMRRVAERYGKKPIDLRVSLHDFDASSIRTFHYRPDIRVVGSGPEWVGTEEMFTLIYTLPQERLDERPEHYLVLFVTYYSDPEDTIPHTPEVCYRQAGGVVRNMDTMPVEIPGRADSPVTIRTLDIATGGDLVTVAYAFYHNGRIVHDRERLRLLMAMPGDRYTYFSKIETVIRRSPAMTHDAALEHCARLFREALVELADRHYPLDASLRD